VLTLSFHPLKGDKNDNLLCLVSISH